MNFYFGQIENINGNMGVKDKNHISKFKFQTVSKG